MKWLDDLVSASTMGQSDILGLTNSDVSRAIGLNGGLLRNEEGLQGRLFPTPKEGGDTAGQNQADISQGMAEGRQRAQQLYGMSGDEIGSSVKDIVARRRAALNAKDPASTSLRQGRNRAIAMARERGANQRQQEQVARDAESRIAQTEFNRQDKTLSDYQRLTGNILSGTTGLEAGYGQLRGAGTANPVPTTSQGFLGSVICSELYVRGYIDIETYKKDSQHGEWLRQNDPFVYEGYIAWAPTVVEWMRKNKTVLKVVAFFGVAWATDMAGGKSLLGKFINTVGQPICRMIGTIKRRVYA